MPGPPDDLPLNEHEAEPGPALRTGEGHGQLVLDFVTQLQPVFRDPHDLAVLARSYIEHVLPNYA